MSRLGTRGLLCVLVAAVGWSVVPALGQDPGYWFDGKWGSSGSGGEQLSRPMGVAVDGAGHVYVADTYNHRIQKLTDTGAFLGWWGLDELGVTGWHAPGSQRTPRWGSGDGQLCWPSALAADGAGRVHVADYGNQRMQTFTDMGAFLTEFGAPGQGDGQFSGPAGVAVDGAHNLYVVDSGNHRVQKLTDLGGFLGWWGLDDLGGTGWHGPGSPGTPASGSGDGEFLHPHGVAAGVAGSVYVADTWNNQIEKSTDSGVFLGGTGSAGNGDGQCLYPYGVAVDAAGNLYMADTWNHRIEKFASTGAFLGWWGADTDGYTGWHAPGSGSTPILGLGPGQLCWPMGVAVDVVGNIYVADYGNDSVQKLKPNHVPVAHDDLYSTPEGTVLTVAPPGVLGNDTDEDGNPLTAIKTSDPAHGTLAFSADGSFTYTPAASFVGTDGFTYRASDGLATSNEATVTIKALACRTLATGYWHRMSVPLQPDDPAPEAVLAGLGQRMVDWRLWDLLDGRYSECPGPRTRDFALGLGFWLAAWTAGEIRVAGTRADPNQPFAHPVPRGWSILGCPHNAPVPWDDAHVQVERNGQVLPLRRVPHWIGHTIYGWDGGHNVPISSRRLGSAIQPWQGYLVWANRACTLHLTHGAAALSAEPEVADARTPSRDDWRIELVAEAGEFSDICTAVGVTRGQAATEPHPPVGPGIDLYVKAAEAFDDGTPGYALDLRGDAASEQTWELALTTPQPEAEVTVRWPDLSELPRELDAYFVDPTTDQRVIMRTVSGYTFETGATGATRDFRVEVRRRSGSAALVTSLSAVTTSDGGAEVAFTLATDATVDATVVNIAGRPVRSIVMQKAMSPGPSTLHWDGRSASGTRAPPGAYVVRLTARRADGQTMSRVTTLTLGR